MKLSRREKLLIGVAAAIACFVAYRLGVVTWVSQWNSVSRSAHAMQEKVNQARALVRSKEELEKDRDSLTKLLGRLEIGSGGEERTATLKLVSDLTKRAGFQAREMRPLTPAKGNGFTQYPILVKGEVPFEVLGRLLYTLEAEFPALEAKRLEMIAAGKQGGLLDISLVISGYSCSNEEPDAKGSSGTGRRPESRNTWHSWSPAQQKGLIARLTRRLGRAPVSPVFAGWQGVFVAGPVGEMVPSTGPGGPGKMVYHELAGIVNIDGIPYALIREAGSKAEYYKVGDLIGSFKLETITPDSVVLVSGKSREVLKLPGEFFCVPLK